MPPRRARSLGEGGDAGDGPAHDQDVHLVGTFVGAYALEVAGVPHRRVLECDAVAAEDGPGLPGNGDRGPDVVELAERDLLREQGPGVLHRPVCRATNRPLPVPSPMLPKFSWGGWD